MNDIEWREHTPFSRQFNDIYFNPKEGLAESYYVFAEGNCLSTRFTSLNPNQRFTICELGFGTGLNFLMAAKCFSENSGPSNHLHFISIERYPLKDSDIEKALANYTILNPCRDAFVNAYSRALRHKNTFWQFDYENIHLRIYFADANFILDKFRLNADAWFFDGFNPKNNQELWSETIFRHIAQMANTDCTFSTFSAASDVRRNLQAAGFTVNKRPGFGRKRESLYGKVDNNARRLSPPWLRPPQEIPVGSHIAVVGAGLAGCLSARRLAECGYKIVLLDRNQEIGQGASGQHRLILYPRLTSDWSILGSYAWLGLAHQYQLIQKYCPQAHDGNGVSLMAYSENETKRLKNISQSPYFDQKITRVLEAKNLSQRIGCTTPYSGIDIAHGGSIDVRRYLHAVIDHPNIKFLGNTPMNNLQKRNFWYIEENDGNELGPFSAVILCTAHDKPLSIARHQLPIKKIRGQVSKLSQTSTSANLKRVLCHKGYISPAIGKYHILGATFNPEDKDIDPNHHHDELNLKNFEDHLSTIAQSFRLNAQHYDLADVAFRATTPDHLPIVGPLSNPQATKELLTPLAKDARNIPEDNFPWIKGLYLNIGHGSRGLIGSALCAEHIASLISGTPSPLSIAIGEHIEAQRFLRREITRSTPRR